MLRAILVSAVTLAGVIVGTGTASADDGAIFNYDVTKGTSTIKKLNASLPLGPGKLSANIDATGVFTATMALPPVRGHFTIFGIFPTSATVSFQQAGPIPGKITDGAIEAHAKVNIQLSNVDAIGFIPLLVGNNCKTSVPATIDLVSAPDFNALVGGDLLATFTIPNFSNCNLATPILNGLIPGPDNKITLTLKFIFE
ncbi:hypothetical protein [Actinocrispum wychmicini]|uniref:Lipid/polyisoprenoid-binding YceI-like domain-containing protein n=1 Tax=Actinocrispum wychmicini TaxID=1213861 RepID=A0A4R2IUE9_9PSEU|nr:hypothetical protein [Actinocrispum wychmicini]TCO46495.1 hypothetical protein EV192_11974 [Actinocrispum wychmicini]